MIPFIRSITELMLICESRASISKNNEYKDLHFLNEKVKSKPLKSKLKEVIALPELPKIERRKWIRSKEAVSKFLKELDYNNQIQSTYELTLLDRQKNYDHHDAA